MPPNPAPEGRPAVALAYHSATGGTRLVVELLADLLSPDLRVRTIDIQDAGAVAAIQGPDLVVFGYPTHFVKPSRSMKEFIDRLPSVERPRKAFVLTTYELYTENSLRRCARMLKDKGWMVTGSAAVRAPGADVTCLLPDRLCAWLYRFQRDLPGKMRAIAREVRALARTDGGPRLPAIKWYTPFSRLLQAGLLDGFYEWRKRIRILPDRCTDCGVCLAVCSRGAWVRRGAALGHDPSRCELCTRCIHRCPRKAIVLIPLVKDNRRLDPRLYARLKDAARAKLGLTGGATGAR